MGDKIPIVERYEWDATFTNATSGHTFTDITFEKSNGTWCSQRWKRIRSLGKGGYGTVYREECVASTSNDSDGRGSAVKNDVGQIRAVKRLKQIHTKEGAEHLNELGLIFKFSIDRPNNFVVAYGWYQDLEDIYISMELFPYGNLEDRLRNKKGRLSNEDCQQITSQLLDGISWLYEEGVIHGDIKPANILVESHKPRWKVKIADFGVSRRLRMLKDKARPEACTEEYAAPEVLFEARRLTEQQADLQYAVDMWSLGVVLLELSTGMPVFKNVGSKGDEVIRNIDDFCKGNVKRVDDLCKNKSDLDPDGLDLVWQLLTVSPQARCNVTAAIEHNFVSGVSAIQPGSKERAIVSKSGSNPSGTKSGKSSSSNPEIRRFSGSLSVPAAILHNGSAQANPLTSVSEETVENGQSEKLLSGSQWKHDFFNHFQGQYWFELDENGSVLLPSKRVRTPALQEIEKLRLDFPKNFRSGYSADTPTVVSKNGDTLKNSANGQKRISDGKVYDNTSNYLYKDGYFKSSVFIPGSTNELFGFEDQKLRIYNLQTGKSLDEPNLCLGTIVAASLLDDKIAVVSVRDVREGGTEVVCQIVRLDNLELQEADIWRFYVPERNHGRFDRRYTLSPDATYLAVHGPYRVSFFDLKNGTLLWHAEDYGATSYCFTRDCKIMITASRRACCIYDMVEKQEKVFHSIRSTDVWISPDDRFLIFNARDFGERFYYTGKVLWQWQDGAQPPKADDQRQAMLAYRSVRPEIEDLLTQLALESNRSAAH